MLKNCSFCDSAESEENPLIAGEDSYICSNCVVSAYKILFGEEDSIDSDENEDIQKILKKFEIPSSVLMETLVSDNGYLLQEENNGKIISINGYWGSGKTYFWKEHLESKLIEHTKKNEKVIAYVSLYGKDSISDIRNEILLRAYQNKQSRNERISATAMKVTKFLSKLSPSIGIGTLKPNTSSISALIQEHLFNGQEYLKDGGIICLDDFERKSSSIDLFDLFGFITNLASELNVKIVIILNTFSFDKDESKIFSIIKEKSIDKFFIYQPPQAELFENIYKAKVANFNNIEQYKELIITTIKETNELNGRIYNQIIENCISWIKSSPKDLINENIIRTLVLVTINFSKNNIIFGIDDYHIISLIKNIPSLSRIFSKEDENLSKVFYTYSEFYHHLISPYQTQTQTSNSRQVAPNEKLEIKENYKIIYAYYLYIYYLDYSRNVEETIHNKINMFVYSGLYID